MNGAPRATIIEIKDLQAQHADRLWDLGERWVENEVSSGDYLIAAQNILDDANKALDALINERTTR